MEVVTVAQMRVAEAAAVAAGVSETDLQATAGAAVARETTAVRATGLIVVLVGPGNNGRDAWVAARGLARAGRLVRMYLTPRHALSERELTELVADGATVQLHQGAESLDLLDAWLWEADLAVDGLLGIGARGSPRSPLSDVVERLNRARTRTGGRLLVLSIDVPSGIDADTGAVEGACVQADATVVLGAVKQGLLRFPAAKHAGAMLGAGIDLPPDALAGLAVRTLDRSTAIADVPGRAPDGHKGTFGRVVVVGGSDDYYGAPFLAGAAALRSGAGLLGFAVAPALQAVLAGLLPEATYLVLPAGAPSEEVGAAASVVLGGLVGAQALVLGPGLGRTDGARELVAQILRGRARDHPAVSAVIDADALYALATERSLLPGLGSGVILTPHHGEMARLTDRPAADIAHNAWDIALEAARSWDVVVVLKGPLTVVAEPGGRAWVWPHANPALGTGGTGDVLAGTIGGLLAQGLEPAAAARLGVYAHAAAALDLMAQTRTDLLLASDLPRAIAGQLSALRVERGDRAEWQLWRTPGWL